MGWKSGQSIRDLIASLAPFVLLTALLLGLAYLLLDPAPPRRVVLATGPEQGAYSEFGRRYQEELARYGVAVELRTTAGAAENLRLLRDPGSGVDIAFVQTGAEDASDRGDSNPREDSLTSLGRLFFEPVWIFYRTESARRITPDGRLTQLSQFSSLSINVGAKGSGAANLINQIFRVNRMDLDQLRIEQMPPTPAVVALLAGELDALDFVSSPESPLVRMLLQTPGIQLLDFPQAQAYERRFPSLYAVTLPRGVIDLALDVPPAEVHLVAAIATLVAQDDVHPALVQLFVQAARRIHGETSWFGPAGEFPNGAVTDFPLNKEAERFYRNGVPLLQRYLPFWLANLIDRMWVVVVTAIAILIPASRIVPPLYELRIRSRVFRWYRRLREIEESANDVRSNPGKLLTELNELDQRAEKITVPLAYADELYALRLHIDMVRKRLQAMIDGDSVAVTPAK